MSEPFDFVQKLLPTLVSVGKELYELFDGDIDLAVAELEDRRKEIAERRAKNDAALRDKYR